MSECDRSLPKFVFSGYWDLLGMYFGLSGPKIDQKTFDRVNFSRNLLLAGLPLFFRILWQGFFRQGRFSTDLVG